MKTIAIALASLCFVTTAAMAESLRGSSDRQEARWRSEDKLHDEMHQGCASELRHPGC